MVRQLGIGLIRHFKVVAKHLIVAGLTPSLITAIDFQPPLDGAMDQLLEKLG